MPDRSSTPVVESGCRTQPSNRRRVTDSVSDMRPATTIAMGILLAAILIAGILSLLRL